MPVASTLKSSDSWVNNFSPWISFFLTFLPVAMQYRMCVTTPREVCLTSEHENIIDFGLYVMCFRTYPSNVLSLFPLKQRLPSCLCPVLRVAPTHYPRVSTFLLSCTSTKGEHHANICLVPVFLSKDKTTTAFSVCFQNRYPWDVSPAARQQVSLLFSRQTSCCPSCVTQVWNRKIWLR